MDGSIKKTSSTLAVARSRKRKFAEEDIETPVGPVGPARPKFVLFGSSIVQYSYTWSGWGANLTDIYGRKADIFLRGYAAWNSRRALEVLDEVFPMDAATHPSLVIVYFGGNDATDAHCTGLGPHVPLDEYVENMRKIVIHLKGLSPTTRLIFLSCPPRNESLAATFAAIQRSNVALVEQGPNEKRKEYSEALIKLCKDMDIKVVDLFNAIQSVDNWQDTCFLEDGVHFSAVASEKVTREILKVLKEADWSPTLYWNSMLTEYSQNSSYYPAYCQPYNVSNLTTYREVDWDSPTDNLMLTGPK